MDGGDGCTAVLIYIILLNCTLKNYENATMRHPLIPVKMAITKKSPNNKCWRGYGEKRTSYTAVGVQIGAATLDNSTEAP